MIHVPFCFPYAMLNALSRKLLFSLMGWTTNVTEPHPQKCIISVAPHTSNWDFIIGKLYHSAQCLSCNFLMKKEWFFWPLSHLFKRMGGIPVERKHHSSLTDQLAQVAIEAKTFSLAITPEGTRSRNPHWKRGFYFIAQKAEIPILLYAIDYKKKQIVCTKTLIPSGDVETDMKIVSDYYRNFRGKHPKRFAIDEGPLPPS